MGRMWTVAEALEALPLSTLVELGGKQYHSDWLGGWINPDSNDDNYYGGNNGFWDARYGLPGDPANDNADAFPFVSGPDDATSVQLFADTLVDGGWRFYSASALDYIGYGGDQVYPMFPHSYADLLAPIPGDLPLYLGHFWNLYPYWQHAIWSDLSGTTRSAGVMDFTGSPIPAGAYALYQAQESALLARDAAGHMPGSDASNVVVIAVDGSGSFGSGSGATQYVDDFIAAFSAAKPGNDVTLIVTKFSDYDPGDYSTWGASGDRPAVLCGTWTGINPGITAPVITSLLSSANNTGGGGDTNETQIEGAYLGMQLAASHTGGKALVVYTDAASVVVWDPDYAMTTMLPPARLSGRMDGAFYGARRLDTPGPSRQSGYRPGAPGSYY